MQAGGTERVISILSNRFAFDGIKIKIFIWRSVPVFYELSDTIEVVDIPKCCGSTSLLKCIYYFRKYLRTNKPDLILGFSAPFNMLSLVTSLGLGIKSVVCERNDPRFVPFSGYQRMLRNLIYRLADGILTQTTHNKDYFSNSLQTKTEVIYNPIFLDRKYRGSALNISNSHHIVSVTRLKEQKNQKLLINSFATFVKQYPDYDLIIYGEGDQREHLESLVEALNLKNKVHLPGISDKIFEKLENAEIFVLPSNFEGMPNTLIEAMCIGLPCISTKVSGATDMIKDGTNGLLVDINSKEQMIEALSYLANNPESRREMGKNAASLYNMLSVEVISQLWLDYIHKILKR